MAQKRGPEGVCVCGSYDSVMAPPPRAEKLAATRTQNTFLHAVFTIRHTLTGVHELLQYLERAIHKATNTVDITNTSVIIPPARLWRATTTHLCAGTCGGAGI